MHNSRILCWPCRTLILCYLSKFNLGPAAADPASDSLFLNGSDWNTHRPDYHAGGAPPRCGSDTNTTDWPHRPCPFITPTCILMYLFSNVKSNRCSSANCFPFLSRSSWEPPWFNGTSKVRRARRHFYSRTFGCLYFDSFVSDYFDSPWE